MKALVIGLDGGSFTVLTPLMQAGIMPNLREAIASGASGGLLSTIPPITALAWPSFLTGKNPGKHGLLGWQARLNENFERPWATGSKIRGAKLWHLTSQAGLRACIVNVPVTYPPEPLNGVMVTGMLTPGLHAQFTYPAQVRDDLLAAVPDYQIDVDVLRSQPNTRSLEAIHRFLAEVLSATRARGRAVRWLLEREQPDLAVVVYEMPDRLQHILWRHVEALPAPLEGARGALGIQEGLLACFEALDQEIGSLVDSLTGEAHLVFLSDHGFGPMHTNLHLNDWLAQKGWLEYERTRVRCWELLRQVGKRVKDWLPGPILWKARQSLPVLRTLGWSRTLAYAGQPTEYGVFLNVRGREPAGIVGPTDYEPLRSKIIEALSEWRDYRDGEAIMKAVYRREELYSGPFVGDAPDIIFECRSGYRVSELVSRHSALSDISHQPWGFHEREGIFAIRGPGVRAGSQPNRAAIQDVLPTLLYALGVPVPDDLDGRVLEELFTPEWRAENPQRSQHAESIKTKSDPTSPYAQAEESVIAERLRGLGYLD